MQFSSFETEFRREARAERERQKARREAASGIVKANGFPLWRKLVDKVLTMMNAGHSEKFCGILLKKTTDRLPAPNRESPLWATK